MESVQIDDAPIPITDYMAKNLITFTPETEIENAIRTLLDNRISGAPVLNHRKEVVGLIDDKDCLQVLIEGVYNKLPVNKHTVGDYMSNVMSTVNHNSNIISVADKFLHSPYKRLLVVDDNGKLVGQISRRDVLRAIKEHKFKR